MNHAVTAHIILPAAARSELRTEPAAWFAATVCVAAVARVSTVAVRRGLERAFTQLQSGIEIKLIY
jgi:hypothetical protein